MTDNEIEKKNLKLSQQCQDIASAMVDELERADLAAIVTVTIRGYGATAGGARTTGNGVDDVYLLCNLAASIEAQLAQLARNRNLSYEKLRRFVQQYIEDHQRTGFTKTTCEGLVIESLV